MWRKKRWRAKKERQESGLEHCGVIASDTDGERIKQEGQWIEREREKEREREAG